MEGGERKESSGEARSRGQAKGFTLGEPPRTRLSWGMGAKERRLLGGSRGEGAKVLEAERGLCWRRAGKDGGPDGEERKLAGEGWGR